jgi:hypothetical protein
VHAVQTTTATSSLPCHSSRAPFSAMHGLATNPHCLVLTAMPLLRQVLGDVEVRELLRQSPYYTRRHGLQEGGGAINRDAPLCLKALLLRRPAGLSLIKGL